MQIFSELEQKNQKEHDKENAFPASSISKSNVLVHSTSHNFLKRKRSISETPIREVKKLKRDIEFAKQFPDSTCILFLHFISLL